MPPRRVELRSRTPLERHAAMRRQSPARRREQEARSRLRAELEANLGPYCELHTPACTRRSQGLHHLLKTSHGGRTERGNCLLSCDACNGWVEDWPDAAHAMGLVVKSWEANRGQG